MDENSIVGYLKKVLENAPKEWLSLTTHRLDIYEEKLAKTQFLEQFENLFNNNNSKTKALSQLPTAYDYIRLGHPLSCVLEWAIAQLQNLKPENVISFSSATMPLLAILRTNLLGNKNTRIVYINALPHSFDEALLKEVYGYKFELEKVKNTHDLSTFNGSTVFFSEEAIVGKTDLIENVDFFIHTHGDLGSLLLIAGQNNDGYVTAIQHVRRRETIAMTPANCLPALKSLVALHLRFPLRQ